MNDLPIRFKLALLAGVPVLGALSLAFLVVTSANEQVRKARSLGSVENLAELSKIISGLVHELQGERAEAARVLGKQARAAAAAEEQALDPELQAILLEAGLLDGAPTGDAPTTADTGVPVDAGVLLPDAGDAGPLPPLPAAPPPGAAGARDADGASRGDLHRARAQYARTDAAERAMAAFIDQRDLSRLPRRLATQLTTARRVLADRAAIRKLVSDAETPLLVLTAHYDASLTPLVEATAALTELVDDGELLRAITSLVTLMKVKEANAAEQAVVAHALAAGEFAPGAYRKFVTLTTAGESYANVFRTLATRAAALDMKHRGGKIEEALAIRERVSAWVDGPAPADADTWFSAQAAKLRYLHEVETELNGEVRRKALSRISETRRALAFGVGLAAVVLAVSIALGWFISFGVSRSVSELRAASERIGRGDLEARAGVRSRDELGRLGAAFNDMARELAGAREAEANQARMARELEIAARLQSAMLPPDPKHAGFEFAGRMVPAAEVGGDFYDVHSRDDSLWLTIGDVSNHGLDSGLVMLMAQSAFATEFQANADAGPDHVLRGVNRVLCENITRRLRDNKYITAQVLQHRGDGRFDCAGGHEPPVVYRQADGECEMLSAIGPWLGIVSELSEVPVSHLQLAPGDVLCLYSDGLTEARNAEGELFDTARLSQTMATALRGTSDLEQVADQILEAVAAHADGRDDDWTLLLVRRAA